MRVLLDFITVSLGFFDFFLIRVKVVLKEGSDFFPMVLSFRKGFPPKKVLFFKALQFVALYLIIRLHNLSPMLVSQGLKSPPILLW